MKSLPACSTSGECTGGAGPCGAPFGGNWNVAPYNKCRSWNLADDRAFATESLFGQFELRTNFWSCHRGFGRDRDGASYKTGALDPFCHRTLAHCGSIHFRLCKFARCGGAQRNNSGSHFRGHFALQRASKAFSRRGGMDQFVEIGKSIEE